MNLGSDFHSQSEISVLEMLFFKMFVNGVPDVGAVPEEAKCLSLSLQGLHNLSEWVSV